MKEKNLDLNDRKWLEPSPAKDESRTLTGMAPGHTGWSGDPAPMGGQMTPPNNEIDMEE